jgi:hypothetical protein
LDAQYWELLKHVTFDTLLRWTGHCNGVSYAQALAYSDTLLPTDCGALNRVDLDGLLAELYLDARRNQLGRRIRVWPSPARGKAQLSYALPAASHVDIVVYDVSGRAVLRAGQGIQRAGVQNASISVAGLAAGTYMARVSVNGVNTTCRFVVCR